MDERAIKRLLIMVGVSIIAIMVLKTMILKTAEIKVNKVATEKKRVAEQQAPAAPAITEMPTTTLDASASSPAASGVN